MFVYIYLYVYIFIIYTYKLACRYIAKWDNICFYIIRLMQILRSKKLGFVIEF